MVQWKFRKVVKKSQVLYNLEVFCTQNFVLSRREVDSKFAVNIISGFWLGSLYGASHKFFQILHQNFVTPDRGLTFFRTHYQPDQP